MIKKLLLFVFILMVSFKIGHARDTIGQSEKLPIIYDNWYNISFFGLENVHPFDSKKYGKIFNNLVNHCFLKKDQFYKPDTITDKDLLLVHTQRYLDSLKNSATLASIAEIYPLKYVPNIFLQRYLLKPMRYATGGTVKAVELALNNKRYAINLSGGYHHASSDKGGGFCVYGDIALAIEKAWQKNPQLKILYVDLDAHQGNGVARYFGEKGYTNIQDTNAKVTLFDMYNYPNYPGYDEQNACDAFIRYKTRIQSHVTGDAYITILKEKLPQAIQEIKPDLIIYNAGTDCYENDPLGHMQLTQEHIIARDAFVFKEALDNKIPVAMTLSGGYTKKSAEIVSSSIKNILKNIVKDAFCTQTIPTTPKKFYFKPSIK